MPRQRVKRNHDLLGMFDSAADGVYAVDGRQRIMYWNRAAEDLLGRRRREVLGKQCFDIIGGEDYEGRAYCRRDCPVIERARSGLGVAAYDVYTRTASGEGVWLNISVMPVQSGRPPLMAAVHICRDVSERRRAEVLAQRTIEAVASLGGENGGKEAAPYPAPEPRLTRREREVLALLAGGERPRQIAEKFGLSPATVRNHVGRILGKLGVHSRLEAVLYASRHRLV